MFPGDIRERVEKYGVCSTDSDGVYHGGRGDSQDDSLDDEYGVTELDLRIPCFELVKSRVFGLSGAGFSALEGPPLTLALRGGATGVCES